jgi:nucleotide-binding universal stress UspA family protein
MISINRVVDPFHCLPGLLLPILTGQLNVFHPRYTMETIICPTDFSDCADNAIQYANELARYLRARLILFHSILSLDAAPTMVPFGAIGEATYIPVLKDTLYEREQLEKLEALQTKLKLQQPESLTQYETQIRYGLVKENLRQLATEEAADLIMMGTEGAAGWDEFLFSSYTVETLKSVDCPLLIIPRQVRYQPIRHIVFATDLEGEPFVAVQLVLQLAALYDAEILFIHILPEDNHTTKQEALARINRLNKALPYDKVSFYTFPEIDIEEGIEQFARKMKADLLVMGHHRHPFWKGILDKDHAKAMAYRAHLPLLVLPCRN